MVKSHDNASECAANHNVEQKSWVIHMLIAHFVCPRVQGIVNPLMLAIAASSIRPVPETTLVADHRAKGMYM